MVIQLNKWQTVIPVIVMFAEFLQVHYKQRFHPQI